MWGDTRFFQCWNFIFYRFDVDIYWFGPLLNFTSVAFALGSILPTAFAQITTLHLVVVLSLCLTVRFYPWRVEQVNVMSFAGNLCLMAMVTLASFFAEKTHLSEAAHACLFVAILMLCSLPVGLAETRGSCGGSPAVGSGGTRTAHTETQTFFQAGWHLIGTMLSTP